jgi:NAD(P)H-hydrate epimerase
MFGSGLSRNLSGVVVSVIDWINASGMPVVSVDLPSGLHPDSGEVCGVAIEASMTVALGYPKRGMYLSDGPNHCGTIMVADIGLPEPGSKGCPVPDPVRLIDDEIAHSFAPGRRNVLSHKGDHGHVLVIAGSKEKSGAAVLACKSAMRAGAGLVTLAIPASAHQIVKQNLVEVMSLALPEQQEGSGKLGVVSWPMLEQAIVGKDCIVVGPGLSQHEGLVELLEKLIDLTTVPLVIDADGLNALSTSLNLLESAKHRQAPIILTPHPGEMARLMGQSSEHVQKNRLDVAAEFVQRYPVYLVLKGHQTVVGDHQGNLFINETGNPAMATAGMGDVLAGMIGAYVANSDDFLEAIAAAVFNHGDCGDRLEQRLGSVGIIASDLIEEIPYQRESLYENSYSEVAAE